MKQFTITIQDKEGLHARPAGLLSGKSGNRFDPQGTATRAQGAVIMQNLCEKTGK